MSSSTAERSGAKLRTFSASLECNGRPTGGSAGGDQEHQMTIGAAEEGAAADSTASHGGSPLTAVLRKS